jgi:GST-like protein
MFLEEIGPPCEIHAVDIGAGDQFKPAFLKFSPNNRLPAVTEEGKMLLFRQTAASVVR